MFNSINKIKMNKFVIFAGMLVTASICLSACDNELTDTNEVNTPNTVVSRAALDTTIEKIDFLYKGVHYSANSTIINDSIISMDDSNVESLLLELDKKPNLITFSYPDGTYEYFDDADDFNVNKERAFNLSIKKEQESQPIVSPRGAVDSPNPNYVANLFLHDNRNYEGRMREFDLPSGQKELVINQLRDYKMNDKTTAFTAITMNGNTLFELFEDDHCRSHCFSFLVTPSTHMGINNGERSIIAHGLVCAPNLKNIHVKGTKRSSWNDRITSIRMTRQ